MEPQKLREATDALIALQKKPQSLDHLPESCQPKSLDEALALQDALIVAMGEPVTGWKMSVTPEGAVMRGAILASRAKPTPASFPAASVPLLGVEAEIAFRLLRDLPPRDSDYSRAEIEDAVIALPAIEVVDSRYVSYLKAPSFDRTADFMSNGGFVYGPALEGWRKLDLERIGVSLEVDNSVLVSGNGGHGAGHPILPAIALINVFRKTQGLKAGQVLTTGTYTGLNYVKPGQTVTARFAGFEPVTVTFPR